MVKPECGYEDHKVSASQPGTANLLTLPNWLQLINFSLQPNRLPNPCCSKIPINNTTL